MNKLRLLPFLIFGLAAVLIVSCKKKEENPNGGTGYTDLQVYVVNTDKEPISGASVALYATKADQDAGTNSFKVSPTGTKGFVYFSELGIATYYITVSKVVNSMIVTAKADTGIPIKGKAQSAVTVVLE